jgi:hypothetical protein
MKKLLKLLGNKGFTKICFIVNLVITSTTYYAGGDWHFMAFLTISTGILVLIQK